MKFQLKKKLKILFLHLILILYYQNRIFLKETNTLFLLLQQFIIFSSY
jgi:hypothetical protein